LELLNMAEPHEHLEQAEHAEHNAHDPFNQRIAVSMAIVAALLAGISMVGHRTHNDVLQLQGDANRLRTEAATAEVEKSNLFAWYQAKKLRQSQLDTAAKLLEFMTGGDELARTKVAKDWKSKAAAYDATNDDHDNLPDLREQGTKAGKKSEALQAKAVIARDEADHAHHQADRLDIAHLLSELGLVLCSIALLTKNKSYWYAGILAAVLAIGLTASAYMIPNEHEHSHAGPAPTDTKGQ
jgi:Domain of unknown function (DUF4337)